MTAQQEHAAAPPVAKSAPGRGAVLVGSPLLLVGVALAAANLRPAITSVGPLLGGAKRATSMRGAFGL